MSAIIRLIQRQATVLPLGKFGGNWYMHQDFTLTDEALPAFGDFTHLLIAEHDAEGRRFALKVASMSIEQLTYQHGKDFPEMWTETDKQMVVLGDDTILCGQREADIVTGFECLQAERETIDAHIITPRGIGFEGSDCNTETFFARAEERGYCSLPKWAGVAFCCNVKVNGGAEPSGWVSMSGNAGVWICGERRIYWSTHAVPSPTLRYNDGCPIVCCGWHIDTPILMMKKG